MKTKHLRLMQRVYIILFFCFMYLPIAYMIVFSFNQSKGYSLFTGFTFKWYRSLFTNASILHALWVSVEVAILSAIIATVLGVILGGLSGYFGKWVDMLIMRIVDIINCIPTLPILLIISAILSAYNSKGDMAQAIYIDKAYNIYILMGVLTLISWTGAARLVRGQILSLREQEYMTACEALGVPSGRRIFKHLVPNIMPQLIVSMTLSLGSMILYEATLGYLDLGVPYPNASWGNIIFLAKKTEILSNYPNIWVPAGICIVLAVLSFNFIGDGLRDALDPRMKR